MTSEENLEALFDKIAIGLIQSPLVDTSIVAGAQKTIRNGIIETGGRTLEDRLVLYQTDTEANEQDLQQTTVVDDEIISQLQNIANQIVDFNTLTVSVLAGADEGTVSISLEGGGLPGGGLPITEYVVTDGEFSNVSQFMTFTNSSAVINVGQANEFLDTNIYELLPTGDSRQLRITKFFEELNALLPTDEPNFDEDGIPGVDREEGTDNWIGTEEYSLDNSITYNGDDGYIHRIKNLPEDDINSTKTIEDIYNRIEPYLTDILEPPAPATDDRPKYQNQSNGYLKFRNPNQGIIIKNTSEDFIKGLDPNNPTWLTSDYNGLLSTYSTESAPYDNTTNFILDNAGTGFTITMWVKFLDKTSQGTLFNFGNPSKAENPFGFKLETYVVNKDNPTVEGTSGGTDYTNFGEFVDANAYLSDTLGLFQNTDSERFVRLQVREFGQDNTTQDYDRGFRSSEIGNPTLLKFTWNAPELDKLNPTSADLRLLSTTPIPEDFNEWYFICASYNPSIIEPNGNPAGYDTSNGYDLSPASNRDAGNEPLFWMNHINPITGNIMDNSGYGNKCKVEIISRSDLLRARGYAV